MRMNDNGFDPRKVITRFETTNTIYLPWQAYLSLIGAIIIVFGLLVIHNHVKPKCSTTTADYSAIEFEVIGKMDDI